MGKHTRPGTPKPECAYGIHYGASEKRDYGMFCTNCGGCTGAWSISRITDTGVILASVNRLAALEAQAVASGVFPRTYLAGD